MGLVRDRLRSSARTNPLLRPFYDVQFHLRRHRARLGRWPNPLRPSTLNEWILRQLVLRRDPLHGQLSDKFGQRRFAEARLADPPLVPILGVWPDVASFAATWDDLPSAFILKPNHGSGWFRVVRDRRAVDKAAILEEATHWMRTSYYEQYREWGYRAVAPCLFAEALIPAPPGFDAPWEYQFYMFGGRLGLLRLRAMQRGEVLFNCFRSDLAPLPLRMNQCRPIDIAPLPAPLHARALMLAEQLTRGLDFLRVDVYRDRDRIWLGELTPFAGAGVTQIEPPEYDAWLGAIWHAAMRGAPFPPPPAGASPAARPAATGRET